MPPQSSKTVEYARDVICLFGLAYDRVTLGEALSRTRDAIQNNTRLHIATPNMNLVRLARSDPAMQGALLSADLVVADGMPLVWLAKFMGLGLPRRVAGSDLFDALHAQKHHQTPTFFFGGTAENAKRLLHSFPKGGSGVRAVGAIAPGFGSVNDMSSASTLAAINATAPSMLVVSISARKGLLWIARNERMLKAPVIANLGAVIHFATGSLKRAPEIWQHSGFEWLWRIRQEPGLWSRYAADFGTLGALLLFHALPAKIMMSVLQRVVSPMPPRVRMVMDTVHSRKVVHLEGSFTQSDLSPLREALASLASSPKDPAQKDHAQKDPVQKNHAREDVTFDLALTRQLDAFALGLILVARGQLDRAGRSLSLTGVRWWMRAWLVVQGCGFLLHRTKARPDTRSNTIIHANTRTRFQASVQEPALSGPARTAQRAHRRALSPQQMHENARAGR